MVVEMEVGAMVAVRVAVATGVEGGGGEGGREEGGGERLGSDLALELHERGFRGSVCISTGSGG